MLRGPHATAPDIEAPPTPGPATLLSYAGYVPDFGSTTRAERLQIASAAHEALAHQVHRSHKGLGTREQQLLNEAVERSSRLNALAAAVDRTSPSTPVLLQPESVVLRQVHVPVVTAPVEAFTTLAGQNRPTPMVARWGEITINISTGAADSQLPAHLGVTETIPGGRTENIRWCDRVSLHPDWLQPGQQHHIAAAIAAALTSAWPRALGARETAERHLDPQSPTLGRFRSRLQTLDMDLDRSSDLEYRIDQATAWRRVIRTIAHNHATSAFTTAAGATIDDPAAVLRDLDRGESGAVRWCGLEIRAYWTTGDDPHLEITEAAHPHSLVALVELHPEHITGRQDLHDALVTAVTRAEREVRTIEASVHSDLEAAEAEYEASFNTTMSRRLGQGTPAQPDNANSAPSADDRDEASPDIKTSEGATSPAAQSAPDQEPGNASGDHSRARGG
jgi:hypothetical protein